MYLFIVRNYLGDLRVEDLRGDLPGDLADAALGDAGGVIFLGFAS